MLSLSCRCNASYWGLLITVITDANNNTRKRSDGVKVRRPVVMCAVFTFDHESEGGRRRRSDVPRVEIRPYGYGDYCNCHSSPSPAPVVSPADGISAAACEKGLRADLAKVVLVFD
ncbi:hypothetical protein EVAR_22875_1 [Eumeta japonica]|uniref:Uncharacterized protein n=1 Tax=Eumeta variegata TaxID=151549 RepID=A0A4C1UVF6_EUMVA|nr:hypothetical protein EVAR_22875_1 [Eumeta japonica]